MAVGYGLEEFFDYKNRLMEDMLTSKTIARLLDDDCSTPQQASSLIYKQVFPYEYIPEVVENGFTFVCCEVDIKEVVSKTFLVPTLYIWVFTHKSKLRLPNGEGVRTDKLSSEITALINGSRYYGMGEMNLSSARRFSPVQDFQGRVLTFVTKDYNRISPTGKPIPSNRKGW